MKTNLKERFVIFVKKVKLQPRGVSNPQPLNWKSNTLVHCATGSSCLESKAIFAFMLF